VKRADLVAALILVGIGFLVWQSGNNAAAADQDDGSDDGSDESGVSQDFIDAWAEAVGIAENVNPAYNNPGGLNEPGDTGQSTPAMGGGVIGIFSSLKAGYAALDSTLQKYLNKYGGDTLLQATAIYILGPNGAAAAAGNYPANVVNEAKTVANNLGVSINDTLSSIAARFGQ
jgi:hypothetical protein